MGWEGIYLVSRSLVRDIFSVLVDVVHGVGHGGDVLLGRAGDAVVCDVVCHDAECLCGVCVWQVRIERVCYTNVVLMLY